MYNLFVYKRFYNLNNNYNFLIVYLRLFMCLFGNLCLVFWSHEFYVQQRDETSTSPNQQLLYQMPPTNPLSQQQAQQQSQQLTQIFDPMIYSQELLTNKQQGQSLSRDGGDDSSNTDGCGGSTDSPPSQPAQGILSAAAMFIKRDENDSTSRKTSTASDYTFSSSDYTPENTIVDGMDEHQQQQQQQLHLQQVATNPITIPTPTNTDATNSGVQSSCSSQPESPQKEPKTTPQRKISRFFVSPVSLSLPQQQLITMDSNKTIQGGSVGVEGSVTGVVTPDTGALQPEVGTPTEGQIEAIVAALGTEPQANKVVGPEHINTLEQLKIGLENITHAHVMNAAAAAVSAGQQQVPQQLAQGQTTTGSGGVSVTAGIMGQQMSGGAVITTVTHLPSSSSGGNVINVVNVKTVGPDQPQQIGGGNGGVNNTSNNQIMVSQQALPDYNNQIISTNPNIMGVANVVQVAPMVEPQHPQQQQQQVCVPLMNQQPQTQQQIFVQQHHQQQTPQSHLQYTSHQPQQQQVNYQFQTSLSGQQQLVQQQQAVGMVVMGQQAQQPQLNESQFGGAGIMSDHQQQQQYQVLIGQQQQPPSFQLQQQQPIAPSSSGNSQTASVLHSRRTSADVHQSPVLLDYQNQQHLVGAVATMTDGSGAGGLRRQSSEDRSIN